MRNEKQDNRESDGARGEHPVRGRLRNAPERFGDFAEDDGRPISDAWVEKQRRTFRVGEYGGGLPLTLTQSDLDDPEFDPEAYSGAVR